jgi:hypothetical protein
MKARGIIDLESLRCAAGNGLGAVAISRLMGVNAKTVRSTARRAGIKIIEDRINFRRDEDERIRELAAAGRTTAEIGKALDRESSAIRNRCRKIGIEIKTRSIRTYTSADQQRLREMIEKGWGRRRIAQAMGAGSSAVAHQAARIGLRFRRERKLVDPKIMLRVGPVHDELMALAKERGISVSAMALDLLRSALHRPAEPQPFSPSLFILAMAPQLKGRIG